MYIEFFIIYVLLGVLALLMAAAIILLCMILKRLGQSRIIYTKEARARMLSSGGRSDGAGVAFCSVCATRYDATYPVCPKCGAPR